MTKEEFIQESAMRNLAAAYSRWSDADRLVEECYKAAVELANLLYEE